MPTTDDTPYELFEDRDLDPEPTLEELVTLYDAPEPEPEPIDWIHEYDPPWIR